MNEQYNSFDAHERHCDSCPAGSDDASDAPLNEASTPFNDTGVETDSRQASGGDDNVVQPERLEQPEHQAHGFDDTTAPAGYPAQGDEKPEPPSIAPRIAPDQEATRQSEAGGEVAGAATGQAAAPGAEGEGQPGTEPEGQLRRVLLEAGTDEESLKALALCREKVSQLHLRMHPLAARWESDRHVVIFFRADDKVDFRKLVRELSRLLHARIELRQVGPREQGKLCGLVGKCGYRLCCQTFLGQFAQSTIKMAKTQELALNPMKISGVCGRLLCCLNYEQEMYLDAKSRMPRVNRMVQTEFGVGRVVGVNVLKETVTVQFETMTKELRPDEVQPAEVQG